MGRGRHADGLEPLAGVRVVASGQPTTAVGQPVARGRQRLVVAGVLVDSLVERVGRQPTVP